jgi:gamma-glutamylcysteine synthetase
LVVGGVELEGGGGLIDRCDDEEIRIMSFRSRVFRELEAILKLFEQQDPSETYSECWVETYELIADVCQISAGRVCNSESKLCGKIWIEENLMTYESSQNST